MAEIVSSLVIAITARNLAKQAISEVVSDMGGMITHFKDLRQASLEASAQADILGHAFGSMGMPDRAKELYDTRVEMSALAQAAGQAAGTAEDEAGAMGRFAAGLSENLPVIGAVAIAVVGLGVAIKGLAETAANFDQMIQITLGNMSATQSEFGALKQAVIELGSATGQNFQDIADAYRHASNEGFNFADSQKLVAAANDLAIETGAKTADITNGLGVLLNDTGLSIDNVTGATNLLRVASQQANTTEQQFMETSGRLTAVTGSLGGGITEVYAAYDALTRAGIPANVVQTQMLGLLKAIVEPTAAASKELKRLADTTGIDLVDDFSLAGLQERGLKGIMDDLQAATAGNTGEILKLIPALRGGQAALDLTTTGTDYFTQAIQKNNEALKDGASANDKLAAEMDTPARKSEILGQRFDALKVSMGEPFSQMGGTVTSVLLGMGSSFDGLGQKLVPFKDLITLLVSPIGHLQEAISHGSEIMNIAKAAAGGLGSAFSDLGTKAQETWRGIADSTAGKAAGDLLSAVGTAANDLATGPLSDALKGAKELWTNLGNSGAAAAAEGFFSDVGGAISAVGGIIHDVIGEAETLLSDLHAIAAGQAGAGDQVLGGGPGSAEREQTDATNAQTAATLESNEAYKQSAKSLEQVSMSQGRASAAQHQGLLATSALNQATAALDAASAKYAGMTLPQMKAARDSDNASMKTAQGILAQLEVQLQAAKEANDPAAIESNTAAIKLQKEAIATLKPDLDAVNAALDENKAANEHAGGASKQAAIDRAALNDATGQLVSAEGELSGMVKTVEDNLRLQYQPAIDKAIELQNKDKASLLALTIEHQRAAEALTKLKDGLIDYTDKVNAAADAVKRQQEVINAQNLTIRNEQDTIKGADKTLTDYKQTLTNLTDGLTAATSAEKDFASATLPGSKAFSDQSDAIKTSMESIQLQMDQIVSTDMGKGLTKAAAEADTALAPLQQQLDKLNVQLDIVSQQSALALDPLKKQLTDLQTKGNTFDFGKLIEQLTNAQKGGQTGLQPLIDQLTALSGKSKDTLTMKQITDGITAAQAAEVALNQAIPGANTAVNTQQTVVDNLNTALEAMQLTLRNEQDVLGSDQKALEDATEARQKYNDQIAAQQKLLDELTPKVQAASDQVKQDGITIDDYRSKWKTAADTIVNNVNPVMDLLRAHLRIQRDVAREVEDQIMRGNIPSLTAVATMIAQSTEPKIDDLTNTLRDHLGIELDDSSKKLIALSTNGSDAAKTLGDELVQQVIATHNPLTTATGDMDAFTTSIQNGQAAAAKGLNLAINIKTTNTSVGGGGGSNPLPGMPGTPGAPGGPGGPPLMGGSTDTGIMGMASGGIVTSPTFAYIGEGGPEAVIPLSELATGGPSIVININNPQVWQTSDINNLVDQIGRQLTQRMLPGAGYASHYR